MKYFAAILFLMIVFSVQAKPKREFYLVQIYHCSNVQQIQHIDEYLENKYLPYLHKKGIARVGVFTPVNNDTATDKRIFVWIPLPSLDKLNEFDMDIEKTNPFDSLTTLLQLQNKDSSLPYNRIETMLAKAFKLFPQSQKDVPLTKTDKRIFEFRSYESANENLHLKKVHMFNEGKETDIFSRLNFNSIFYAKVLVGSRMPNLIYMTSFNDMADRDSHWKSFSADPYWKSISTMPAYAKTVSKADIVLMYAKSYADY